MGKQWKQCQTLFFGGSKITADGDWSQEIKRCLLLGRKVMTNLDSMLKSRPLQYCKLIGLLLIKINEKKKKKKRHYFASKVHLVKAMIFPVVMYGCESWTVKKAERQRIDAFELWCWRRLLRLSWTTRRSNQSILNGINPECSLEGLMLRLKPQYFGHFMQRLDSLEKTLILGGIGGQEEKWTTEDEMAGWHHRLDGHQFE